MRTDAIRDNVKKSNNKDILHKLHSVLCHLFKNEHRYIQEDLFIYYFICSESIFISIITYKE